MKTKYVIAALLLASLLAVVAKGVVTVLAPDREPVQSAANLTAQEFSQESPFLLPGILASVYDAFGQTEETLIYDRLADVATGPALEQLYLERIGAMAGGGLNPDQKIHEIALLNMGARPSGGSVEITAKWRVLGVVGHAEHMHMRGNAYAADLIMAPEDGRWKIAGFALTDVDRTDAGTLERNADAPPETGGEDES